MNQQITSYPKGSRKFSTLKSIRWLLLLGFTSLAFAAFAKPPINNQPANNQQVEAGRRIYMEGILPSGKPLKGKRANSVEVQGIAAACETCHRRSGMGSLEGNIVVPPITGRFLFANENNRPIALVDPRAPKNVSRAHNPYTQSSLAKAIRKGINVGNRPLSPLMPHYDLSNAEIKALMVYLRQLSAELSPGVGEDTLHFATVVTPDVDPKKQEAMLGMMQKAFTQRNASQEDYSGRMRMPIDLIPRTLRNWQLTVWKLKGAPDTWAGQLAEKYRKEPVFAVISGLSNTTWQPVHFFVSRKKSPVCCLVPPCQLRRRLFIRCTTRVAWH